MDDDLIVRCGVEDHVGIRVRDDASKGADVRGLAGVRVQGDEVNHGLDPSFYVMGALRGALIDIREDLVEFFGGAKRVS